MNTLASFFDEFFDTSFDMSVDDNLRWAIMSKVIVQILENCSPKYLAEVMVEYTKHFEEILKKPFKGSNIEKPINFYLLVREKTHIFNLFEIFYRRLSEETIKGEVHKKLYGPESQGNELTKVLIGMYNQVKKGPIEGFLLTCGDKGTTETEFPQLNSVHEV